MLPLVPVIIILSLVTAGAVELAVSVSVEVQVEFGVQLTGLNLAVTPVGRLLALKLTFAAVPCVLVMVTVVCTESSLVTEPEGGFTKTVKSKAGTTVTVVEQVLVPPEPVQLNP